MEKVTDYHGADIRPLEMSRIGADWAIRIRNNPDYGLYFNPYTSLVKMSEIAENERDSRSQTKSNIKCPPKQISKQTEIKDSTRNPI